MPLKLKEILQKAEEKGIVSIKPNQLAHPLLKPWQHESTLYKKDNKIDNTGNNTDNISNNLGDALDNIPDNLSNKPGNKQGNKINISSGNEIDNKQLKFNLSMLNGLQRKIFSYILNLCLANQNLNTGPISTKKLADEIECSYGSLKMSIIRLIRKDFITRIKGKSSRAGYVHFSINKNVKEAAIDLNYLTVSHKLTKTLDSDIDNKSGSNFDRAYSVSSSNIKNTTTDEENAWTEIDIQPLAKIGFTVHHIYQLASWKKLTPETVQQSIYAFAFDLEVNNKSKELRKSPIHYFMGILRNGIPYTPPDNYESPEEKAMRLFVEKQQNLEKKHLELEQKAFNFAFEHWIKTLTDEQKEELIIQGNMGGVKAEAARLACWRNYFREHIWPEKRAEILSFNGV